VPPEGEPDSVLSQLGLQLREACHLPPLQHTFTHFKLQIEPVLCLVEAATGFAEHGFEWIPLADAADAGLPAPMRQLVRQVASAKD
jgi:A/G-specific adenine glycosylase